MMSPLVVCVALLFRVTCAPVVRVSNLLNIQDVEGSDDIYIKAGRLYAVPVSVNVPDTVLIWHFSTQPKVCTS